MNCSHVRIPHGTGPKLNQEGKQNTDWLLVEAGSITKSPAVVVRPQGRGSIERTRRLPQAGATVRPARATSTALQNRRQHGCVPDGVAPAASAVALVHDLSAGDCIRCTCGPGRREGANIRYWRSSDSASLSARLDCADVPSVSVRWIADVPPFAQTELVSGRPGTAFLSDQPAAGELRLRHAN
jgi:hypothetical protein